jgi:hypothetical protein
MLTVLRLMLAYMVHDDRFSSVSRASRAGRPDCGSMLGSMPLHPSEVGQPSFADTVCALLPACCSAVDDDGSAPIRVLFLLKNAVLYCTMLYHAPPIIQIHFISSPPIQTFSKSVKMR